MKGVLLAILIVSFLLFGCAIFGGEQPKPQDSNTAVEQPPTVEVNVPPPAPPSEPVAAPPELPPAETCAVQFQRDTSNIYYVMVKTDSAGEVSVVCPNGKPGVKQNGLFFCSQLDLPDHVVAYIGQTECGRAKFTDALPSGKSTDRQSCNLSLGASSVKPGAEVYVTAKVYVPGKSRMTFNCGDYELIQMVDGMAETVKLCKFNTPGAVEVYLKLNGEKCSSKILGVG